MSRRVKANDVEYYEVRSGGDIPVHSRTKYPWEWMKVGKWFLAPLSERRKLSSAAYGRARKYGERYTLQKISEDTVKVWRTA